MTSGIFRNFGEFFMKFQGIFMNIRELFVCHFNMRNIHELSWTFTKFHHPLVWVFPCTPYSIRRYPLFSEEYSKCMSSRTPKRSRGIAHRGSLPNQTWFVKKFQVVSKFRGKVWLHVLSEIYKHFPFSQTAVLLAEEAHDIKLYCATLEPHGNFA